MSSPEYRALEVAAASQEDAHCRPFAQRYSMLLTSGKGAYQPLDMALSDEAAADICRRVLLATKAEGWQLGKSRVFLRSGQLALLEVQDHSSQSYSNQYPPASVSKVQSQCCSQRQHCEEA